MTKLSQHIIFIISSQEISGEPCRFSVGLSLECSGYIMV